MTHHWLNKEPLWKRLKNILLVKITMLIPKDTGLKFLIVTHGFWSKGDNISVLKQKAVRNSTWPKGTPAKKKLYMLYLVHEDTEIINEEFVFSSHLAKDTAIYLGPI